MSKYTTGELAKLCNVSVRTVQFYDTKELLPPTELTEGGRRMYCEKDLKKLRMICLLKSLGLSLDSIKGILNSPESGKVMTILLEEQYKQVDEELKDRQRQKEVIKAVLDDIRNLQTITVDSIIDIEHIMNGKRKLKKTYALMLVFGIIMDIIQVGALLLWIFKGMWLPFAILMPVVILMGILLVRMYYKNAAYICPNCNAKFKPAFWNFFFARHTLKTRKLKCTKCGYTGYCVETYADDAVDRK